MQFFCIMYLSSEVSRITCRFDNALFCYNSNSNCTLHRLSALKKNNFSWYNQNKTITTFINICFYTICGVCRVKQSKYKYTVSLIISLFLLNGNWSRERCYYVMENPISIFQHVFERGLMVIKEISVGI